MRFSLFSVIVLTFWIALCTQMYLGRQRLAMARAEEEKAKASINQMRREIEVWRAQDLKARITAAEQELGEVEKLNTALVSSFAQEAEKLSELRPRPETVSIRTMPVMGIAQRTVQSVKVSVPKKRPVALQVLLHEKDAPRRNDDPSVSSTIVAVPGLKGEHPVTVPLSSGVHLIECLYDYRDDKAPPYFLVRVDGEKVSRLTCPDDGSGYSSSRSNWFQQQDIAPQERLPKLMSVTPSGLEAEIVVRLIEGNDERRTSSSPGGICKGLLKAANRLLGGRDSDHHGADRAGLLGVAQRLQEAGSPGGRSEA